MLFIYSCLNSFWHDQNVFRTIGIRSRVNRDAVFFFTLPLQLLGATKKDSIPSVVPLAISPSQLKVLVVEDIATNRKLLIRCLEKNLGFISDSAVNGVEAVEMCSQKAYDLILIDNVRVSCLKKKIQDKEYVLMLMPFPIMFSFFFFFLVSLDHAKNEWG